jgi:hypothetical protein
MLGELKETLGGERELPHCVEIQTKTKRAHLSSHEDHGLNHERISNKGENLCKIAIIIFRFCDIFDFKCVTSTGLLPTGREIDVQINRSLNWIPNFSLQISFKLY